PPIADTGLDNMTVTVQYGGQTKDYTSYFDASDDTPGEYDAAMMPSQIGTYNLIIKGNIDGVTIPTTTYPMQDVEAKDKYYFPPTSGQNMPATNMPGQNQQMTNMTMPASGNQAVPEFGPVASLVLVIAIISAVVFTGRMRGFLKLSG
ncbi:MAG: PEFG-CTERM sorting domain-containing protein, partial [Rhabdochlamydiaceae bacterium]